MSAEKLVDGFYWIEWAGGEFSIAERTTCGGEIHWNTIGSDDYYTGDDKIVVIAGPLEPPSREPVETEEAPEQRFVAAREGDVFLPVHYVPGGLAAEIVAVRPYERGCVVRGGNELIPAIRQPDGSIVVLETSTISTSSVAETQK